MNGVISMSTKEVKRVGVMERLVAREMKQHHAATLLSVSTRQIKRMVKEFRAHGASSLAHKGRGKVGNRALADTEKKTMIDLIKTRYPDFGPTLIAEKFAELHGIHHADETIRNLMIREALWKAHPRKIVALHQLRERRACEGELVQADGSPHDWFEGRSAPCTLLVFIDDATGKLLWLEFAKSESTSSYMIAMKHYLTRHGKPCALYVDKHGVFRVNTTKAESAGTDDSNGRTQFGRAMDELKIDVICAETAEAKGRVERVNQTLQDRLVKEMRLLGINTMEDGNIYVQKTYMEIFNKKFSVVPKSPTNMHTPLLETEHLENILCIKHTRTLSKQLSCSYQDRIYQINTERPLYTMRHAKVEIQETMEHEIRILYKGVSLPYTTIKRQPKSLVVDAKQLNETIDACIQKQKTLWIPPVNHPWRHYQI